MSIFEPLKDLIADLPHPTHEVQIAARIFLLILVGVFCLFLVSLFPVILWGLVPAVVAVILWAAFAEAWG